MSYNAEMSYRVNVPTSSECGRAISFRTFLISHNCFTQIFPPLTGSKDAQHVHIASATSSQMASVLHCTDILFLR